MKRLIMYKKGFLLIECMVYCALSAIMVCCAMQILLKVQTMSKHATDVASSAAAIELALDIFAQDIAQAVPDIECWQVKEHETFFSTDAKTTVAWRLEENRLIRDVRTVSTKKEMPRVIKNVAIEHCKNISLSLHVNNEGHAESVNIMCEVQLGNTVYRTQRCAYLYNRTLE